MNCGPCSICRGEPRQTFVSPPPPSPTIGELMAMLRPYFGDDEITPSLPRGDDGVRTALKAYLELLRQIDAGRLIPVPF